MKEVDILTYEDTSREIYHGTDRQNAKENASRGHSQAFQNNDNRQLQGSSIRHILFNNSGRRFANKINICLVPWKPVCVCVANLFYEKGKNYAYECGDGQAQTDVLIDEFLMSRSVEQQLESN